MIDFTTLLSSQSPQHTRHFAYSSAPSAVVVGVGLNIVLMITAITVLSLSLQIAVGLNLLPSLPVVLAWHQPPSLTTPFNTGRNPVLQVPILQPEV